ncbi:hypothetical protein [Pseudothauera rhizosphaerae]|uniref:hypothetical protein n=1 Tax=Pseudothauera rhizosphaerae TaxID=2565932 RepID=UPI001E54FBF9|nr:hypothetical protein [Pseudothauera rhizosphaerae]
MTAWLAAEPADDPAADLDALRAHVRELRGAVRSADEYLDCLTQLDWRARDIAERFRARLLNAPLPLGPELRQPVEGLVDALLDLAAGFQLGLEDVRGRWFGAPRAERGALTERALRLSGEAYLFACMIGAQPPTGFWLQVYALFGLAELFGGGAEGEGAAALAAASRILAVAALQPESLTGRELVWVHDYLENAEADGRVGRVRSAPESSLYWMDPARDEAPVAASRRGSGGAPGLFYFNSDALAQAVADRLEWLELRIAQAEVLGLERDVELLDSEHSGLPAGLTPVEVLSLLRRMHERWNAPPYRESPRQHQEYTVQVCAGLRAIWELFQRGEQHARIAEWMVYNESPGGYAIISVSGVSGVLSAGMVLALRPHAGKPWSLCIVRWIRSDDAEQVELGLQVIAQGGEAATVGFRGGDVKTMTPALVLPPLPGVRHGPAILVQTGSYTSRRFVLISDGGRLYVAQGRVTSLDMQTANIELLQYEIDPYPL